MAGGETQDQGQSLILCSFCSRQGCARTEEAV